MEEEGMGKGLKTSHLADRYLELLDRWGISALGPLYIPDGSFLRSLLNTLEKASTVYRLHIEDDRAVSMSMGAFWRNTFANFADKDCSSGNAAPICGDWHDSFHGACVSPSRRRAAMRLHAAEDLPSSPSAAAKWPCTS